MALVAVLWLVAILTMLATSVAMLVTNHRHLELRSFEAAVAERYEDSALRVVLLELSAPRQKGRQWLPGLQRTLQLFDRDFQITVQREAGRVDLNFADVDLIAAVFAANGYGDEAAARLAQNAIAWRSGQPDVENIPKLEVDAAANWRARPPRNASFETPAELRQVVGFQTVSDQLLDAFTVYAHLADASAVDAPVVVRNALKWRAMRNPSPQESTAIDPVAAAAALSVGDVFRVKACALPLGAYTCRAAIVRLTGRSFDPFQIFSWFSQSIPAAPD